MAEILGKVLGIGSITLSATSFLSSGSFSFASEIPDTRQVFTNQVATSAPSVPTPEPIVPYSLDQYFSEAQTLDRVTPVSQLSDVMPTDWAYQALQSLNQRYSCLAGYPDGSYQGDRSLTRHEFAASLAACLEQVQELVRTGEILSREDLVILERLQSEFAIELSTIETRIDSLEVRTSELEAQQFSTTTQLRGEAVFGVVAINGGDKADGSGDAVEETITFGSRVRIGFDTSFTGDDSLFVRLQAENFPDFQEATGTPMARLGFDGSTENQLEVDTLKYTFPIGEQVTVHVNAQSSAEDFVDTLNPLLDSSGRGTISRFGRRNPIYRQMGSRGIGIDYAVNDQINVGVGYLADQAGETDSGLFNGAYGAIAQVVVRPSETLSIGLAYVRSYNNLETDTGSLLANDPFDEAAEAVTANSFGIQINSEISSGFSLGGWAGYTRAVAEDLPNEPAAEIFNYAITLAFPDLGGEGNLAGLVIGQPPKVTNNDLGNDLTDVDTSLHLEVFYRLQATDHIFITPGLLIITNPNHNASNETLYLAVIRTTLRF